MISKIDNIINELKTLTLLEITELIKKIEKEFNIDTVITNPSAEFNRENITTQEIPITQILNKEEKTTFDILLMEVPLDKKIAILKVVRTITGFGLKESKDIVDNVPKVIKEGVSKEEAEIFQKELENLGAKVILK